jgi:hypothetical protein
VRGGAVISFPQKICPGRVQNEPSLKRPRPWDCVRLQKRRRKEIIDGGGKKGRKSRVVTPKASSEPKLHFKSGAAPDLKSKQRGIFTILQGRILSSMTFGITTIIG